MMILSKRCVFAKHNVYFLCLSLFLRILPSQCFAPYRHKVVRTIRADQRHVPSEFPVITDQLCSQQSSLPTILQSSKENDDDDHDHDHGIKNVNDYSYWHVFQVANQLEHQGITTTSSSNPMTLDSQMLNNMTQQTVNILRLWGSQWAGQREWQSLLNKSTLLHEIEECIVTLVPLIMWLNNNKENNETSVILLDACCGKGVFSMLASYIFQNDTRIQSIIMLDKATTIDWNHILLANKDATIESRPHITVWGGCNLHDVDQVVDRLENLSTPVAMIGLHLCKTLSPTLVGIVNVLGPSTVPYFMLAPCCLPRNVYTKPKDDHGCGSDDGGSSRPPTMIDVLQYESDDEKKIRQIANARRKNAMQRGNRAVVNCYLCQSVTHKVYDCHRLPATEQERTVIFEQAKREAPCWKCGQVGHLKQNCPSPQQTSKPSLVRPPMAKMDVSRVITEEDPFTAYCEKLALVVQRDSVKLMDAGLVRSPSGRGHREIYKSKGRTWNMARKSLLIIASSTTTIKNNDMLT